MTLINFQSKSDDCDVILSAIKHAVCASESAVIKLVILVTWVRLADKMRVPSVHLEFERLVIRGRVQAN